MTVIDIVFVSVNALARLALTLIGCGIMRHYADRLNDPQRYGLGLLAGASFMTIPVVIDFYTKGPGTPFDMWANTALSVGMVLFLSGTLIRVKRHSKANEQQIFVARGHLQGRGKL